MFFRNTVLAFAAIVISGCAAPARIDFDRTELSATQKDQVVFLASHRGEVFSEDLLGEDRVDELNYMTVDIGLPEGRNPGQVNNFALDVTPNMFASQRDFVRAVWDSREGNPNTAFVFVHGYNTTDAEAAVRLAQLQEDYKTLSQIYPSVLFTWQSSGRTFGYLYDRDSALFARNALEDVITSISGTTNRKVIILAHSMGTLLTMEVLQKMNDKGINIRNNVAGVVLIAPDIDPDVFESQVKSMRRVPTEFAVLSAPQDRALKTSEFLRGGKKRLGQLTDQEGCKRFAEYDVKFMRVGQFDDGSTFAHNLPFISNRAISQITNVFGQSSVAQRWFRPSEVPIEELEAEAAAEASEDILTKIDEIEAAVADTEMEEMVADAIDVLERDPENLQARCIIATAVN